VIRTRMLPALAAVAISALAAAPSSAAPAPEPALSVTSLATPTNFKPGGEEGVRYIYDLRVANVGGAPTNGLAPITITDTLPKGITVKQVTMDLRSHEFGGKSDYAGEACETETVAEVTTVTCELSEGLPEADEPATIQPEEERRILIQVNPPPELGGANEGEALDNHVVVEGGEAPPASTTSHNEVSSEPADAGISLFHTDIVEPDGLPATEASGHPFQLTLGFAVHTKAAPGSGAAAFVPAGGDIKDIEVGVPPGLVGNPTAMPRCTPLQFSTTHNVTVGNAVDGTKGFFIENACPDSSVVGLILVQQIEGEAGLAPTPLYNLEPPPGVAAEFGAQILSLPFYIDFEVRPRDNYKIVARLRNLTQVKRLTAASTIIWGTPANPLHDPVRGSCLNRLVEILPLTMPGCEPPAGEEKPFLRLPTSCISPLDMDFSFDNWTEPGLFVSETSPGATPSACNQVDFEPGFEAAPTTEAADSPTGLHADVHLPQNEDPEARGEADLRKTVVTLPKGLALNPASANGLDTCSAAEIGFEGEPEGFLAFSNEPAQCPPASRVGSVEVHTPLIDHPLPGSVYVATPHENPFDSLLAIYIAVHDPVSGVVVKLPGKVEPDPVTGQLTTTFDETPQTPFEDFELNFFSGANAALRTPAVCGTHASTAVMTPWSAPESGPPITESSSFAISQPAAGQSSCPTSEGGEPNAPTLEAGTISPIAGIYSPLTMHLRREDGTQEFGALSVTPPPGLLARLAGVPYCPEGDIATAAQKSGSAENQSPSCPAASEVGSVQVGAGAGPTPYYTKGRVYLAGPYKGAPLSLAIVTPAVAGPYDLGTVVVRTALYVDPETARITAKSDPIPHILEGIVLDVRSVLVKIDRPSFTLNPTSCDPLAFGGELTSTLGQAVPLSRRFQVGECGRLRFRPSISFSLKGGTGRNQNPAVKSVVTYPKGGAYSNVARAQVALPHSEFLDNEHFRTICTRVQFAANACPKGSIYGRARATTPLLDEPLRGPVYLRSSSHPLPDLVVSLGGQIPVVLVGRIDESNGGIRTTFEGIPDAPVSKFVLELQGGKKGILVNSTNICKGTHRATARLTAQNGRFIGSRPLLKAKCPRRHAGKRHRRGR